MKTRFTLAVLTIMLCSVLFSAPERYSITTGVKESDTQLLFSREFFVNNIYLDFMVPFGLDTIFSESDYLQIFTELYNDLSVNYQKVLDIPVSGDRMLSILFKFMPVDDHISLMVISNYDIANKKLVAGGKDLSGCYSKQYFIVRNSLVPGHIFYIKDREGAVKKFRDESDYNGLADFYLFDDDSANDKDIPGILSAGFKKTPAGYNACMLKLTESQYFIFNRKFNKADISLRDAGKLATAITDPAQKKFITISVKLMRRVLNISRNIQNK